MDISALACRFANPKATQAAEWSESIADAVLADTASPDKTREQLLRECVT